MPTFLREVHLKRHNLLDILFRNVTRLSAFAVLVLLVAIIVSLIIGSIPSIKAFGFQFFDQRRMESGHERVRRTRADRWHAGTLLPSPC